MNGAQREVEAKAVLEFYTARGWDASHVVAYILNRREPTEEMGTGAELIAEERAGHLLREGFTPRHDAEHTRGELAQAAACYAIMASYQARTGAVDVTGNEPPLYWPWEACWWKPSNDPIKNLKRAGALAAAEIDRQRLIKLNQQPETESQLEMPVTKAVTDTERLDLIEKLDATLSSDGGAGDGPSVWKMQWRVGNRNDTWEISVEGQNVREVIDHAARRCGRE